MSTFDKLQLVKLANYGSTLAAGSTVRARQFQLDCIDLASQLKTVARDLSASTNATAERQTADILSRRARTLAKEYGDLLQMDPLNVSDAHHTP